MRERTVIIDVNGNVRPVPPGVKDLSNILKNGERLRFIFLDEHGRGVSPYAQVHDGNGGPAGHSAGRWL